MRGGPTNDLWCKPSRVVGPAGKLKIAHAGEESLARWDYQLKLNLKRAHAGCELPDLTRQSGIGMAPRVSVCKSCDSAQLKERLFTNYITTPN